ncbi:MAG: peptidylprolyl isomerase [Methyloceanibacter sp.]|uniref:peptidylprolyl isomerase n=1 Tax=Methyloceanibacter sp. TaxID=1965321 RepID=UPI003D9B2D8E
MKLVLSALITAFLVAFAPGLLPASAQTTLDDVLLLDLKDGRVTILLRPDLAPKHVERAKQLARDGFYDGIVFHRVIDGFMAQSGDPTGTGTGGSNYGDLPAEFTNKAKFVQGTVGAARAQDPNSANSQFFITFGPAPFLDGQYTIWGQVIDGMDAVDKIKRGEPPSNPDKIVKVQVASDADQASQDAATAVLQKQN